MSLLLFFQGFYGAAAAIDGEGKIFVYGGISDEKEVVGSTATWDSELEMWESGKLTHKKSIIKKTLKNGDLFEIDFFFICLNYFTFKSMC